MADFKLPVAPIFDGESFELDGDIIKGKGGGGGAEPDDATIELNADGKLQIKDEGVSLEKMATIDTSHAGEFYKVGDDGRPTFGSVETDDTTIEFNASDELQVKDRGITLEKMSNQGTVHANEIYLVGSDGNPIVGDLPVNDINFEYINNGVGKKLYLKARSIKLEHLYGYPLKAGATLMLDSSGNPKYDYTESVFEFTSTRECGEFIIPEMYGTGDLDAILSELQNGRKVSLKYYIDGDTTDPIVTTITSANLRPEDYELGNSGLTSTLNGKTVEWYYPDEDGMVAVKAAGGGGATLVSVESTDRAYISDKTEVGYKLGDNVYWFSGIYDISGSWSPGVGEDTEIVGDFSIDGKRVKTNGMIAEPLIAYTSRSFKPCGAGFVDDYRTSNNMLLFNPVEEWVGGMIFISGIIETEES